MSQPRREPVRWIEEPEDPELEERLRLEIEERRLARIDERRRKAAERRSRRLFWSLALLVLLLVVAIAYGGVTIARTLFG